MTQFGIMLPPKLIKATRTIDGAAKLCSIQKLLNYFGRESLQNRRNKHNLIIIYK